MFFRVLALIGLMLLPAVAWGGGEPDSPGCIPPDGRDWLMVGGNCLGIETFGADNLGPRPQLVVLLHGDSSQGGPVDYFYPIAREISEETDVVTVALLRPGYADGHGKVSDGRNWGRVDGYTAENVDLVAAALKQLRQRYKARRLIVLGHSGGAATTAILIGKHPGLVDVALLVSCPCDIVKWNQMIRRPAWTRSLLPMAFLDRVDRDTDVVAMTGTGDGWTAPATVTGYVDRLKARGVDARFIPVPVAAHDFKPLWLNGVKRELVTILHGNNS
ncbi:alpha/beta hydrolase family protein [Zavarzinia compransoris]|uniref:AB hydrolase-1 domain-containing protein n=1 Tax=Zavarzinia compransoris TaxID=1264899 RepID=A0A317DYG5_9PROT|nr:alpha/beta hydrolase [Zavarzinia compransoris]PWR18033.1 hypothetical protein DKG75_21075 [Zavarzinia compransoris]TDP43500.1 alpha/beta hydrolase family protein [Zavarzinia compransoris]